MEKALYSCPAAGGGDRNKCGQIKVKDVTPIFSCDPNFRGGDPKSIRTLYYWGSSPRRS